MERSFVTFGSPNAKAMGLGEDMPVAREIQASLMIVPKNKKAWTGLDMLREHNDRLAAAHGTLL